ncbi:hypothetical protein Ddc_11128 [Ditylenchus destructor]|nr:hypothetical protein Ddc_11128 [Ditylenchus destructor]
MSSKSPDKPPNIVRLSFWILALCWIGSSVATPESGDIHYPEQNAPGKIHYPEQNAPPPGSRSRSTNTTVHDFKLPEGSCYDHEQCNSTSECDKIDKSMAPGHCHQCEKIFEGAYYCPRRKPHVVFCQQNITTGTIPGLGSGLPIKGHVSGHLDFSFEFGQGVGQSNCDTKPNCGAPVEKPKCDVSDILKILGVVKPACQPEPVPSDPSGNVDLKTLCELARLNDQIRLALGGAYKLLCENGSQTEPPLPTLPSINPTILNPLNITASSIKHSRPTRFPPVLPSEPTRKPRPSRYPIPDNVTLFSPFPGSHTRHSTLRPHNATKKPHPRPQHTDYPFFTPSQNANTPEVQYTDYPYFTPSQNAVPPGLNATDYPFFTPSQNANPPVHSHKTPKVHVKTVRPHTATQHHHRRTTPMPQYTDYPIFTPSQNANPPVHPHQTPKVHVKTVRPHTATHHHHRRTTPRAQYTDYPIFEPSQNANPHESQNTDYPIFTPSQNANPHEPQRTDYPYFTPSQNANPPVHSHKPTHRKHHTTRSPAVNVTKRFTFPIVDVTPVSPGGNQRTSRRPHPSRIPPGRVQTSKVHVETVRPHTVTQHHHRRTTPKAQYTNYPFFTPSQNANPTELQYTDYPIFSPSQNANPHEPQHTDYPFFTPSQNANSPVHTHKTPKVHVNTARPHTVTQHHHRRTTPKAQYTDYQIFTPSQNANPHEPQHTDYPFFTPSQNANSPVHTHKTPKVHVNTARPHTVTQHHHRRTTPKARHTNYPFFTPSQNAYPTELQYTDYPFFTPSQNANPPDHQKTGFSVFTPSQNAEPLTSPAHSRKTPKTRATRPPRRPTRETRQTAEDHKVTTVRPQDKTSKARKTRPPHVHPRVTTPELFVTRPSHVHQTRPEKTHSTRKHRPTKPPHRHIVTATNDFEVVTPKIPEERHIEEQTTPARNKPSTADYETVTPKKKKIVTPKGKTAVSRRNEPPTDHTAGYDTVTPKASEGPKKHSRKPHSPSPRDNEPTTGHSVSHKIRTPKVSKVTHKPASPRRNEPSTAGYEITTPKVHKKTSKHPKPSRHPETPENRNIEPSTAGYEIITPKGHKKTSKHPKPTRRPKTPESRVIETTTARYKVSTAKKTSATEEHVTHRKNDLEVTTSRAPRTPRVTKKHENPRVNHPEVTTPQAPRTPKRHQTSRRNEPLTTGYATVTPKPSRASKPTPGPNRTPKHEIFTPKLPKVSKAPRPKPSHPTPDKRHGHNDGPATTPGVTVWPKFTPTTESGEVTKRKKHEKIKLEMSVSVEDGPRTRPPNTAELFGEERHHVTHRTRKPRHKKTQEAAFYSSDIDPEEELQENEQLTTQGPPKKPRQKAFAMFSSNIEAGEDTQDEKQSTTPKAPKKVGAKKPRTSEKPKSPSPGLHERSIADGGMLKPRKPKSGARSLKSKATTGAKSFERGWGQPLATQTVQSIDLATQTVQSIDLATQTVQSEVTAKPVKTKHQLGTNSNPKKTKSVRRGGLKSPKPTEGLTLAPGSENIRETDGGWGIPLSTQTVHGIDLATQTVQSVTNPPAKVKPVTGKRPKAARKSNRQGGLKALKPIAETTLAPGRVEVRETELPREPEANVLKKSNRKPAGFQTFSLKSAPEVSEGLTQGPPRSESGTTQPKPEAKSLKVSSGKPAGVNTFGRRALPPSPASPGHVTNLPERFESRSTQLDPKDRKVTPDGPVARKSTTENPLKRKSAELIKEGIEELISSDEKQAIKCNPKANSGKGDCPSGFRCYPPYPKSSFGYCYENAEFSPTEEKVSKSSSASGELKDGPL